MTNDGMVLLDRIEKHADTDPVLCARCCGRTVDDTAWPGMEVMFAARASSPARMSAGQGDEPSAAGKRILRARPNPGEKELEHRRTMRDVRPAEAQPRMSPTPTPTPIEV